MFFAGLPRYTAAPRLANGRPADPDAPALTLRGVRGAAAGVGACGGTPSTRWTQLDGRTPLQAWLDDPTPLTTVPAQDLRLFTLEDDGQPRKITTKGVQWRGRLYVGAVDERGQVGRTVRVRWMPHHDHEIEVFDAATGAHLGRGELADQASRAGSSAWCAGPAGARRARLARELQGRGEDPPAALRGVDHRRAGRARWAR